MDTKEAINIVEKKMNDKVISGIEYKNCFVFSIRKYSIAGNSSGVFINKRTGKIKTIHTLEPVIENGKNIVANNEIVRFIKDIS